MTRMQSSSVIPTQNRQLPLILSSVFLLYLSQMTLNPVIAPLSREIHLAEWQVGLMISTAAVMVVITSQLWGRRSQRWGSRPVLIGAMVVAFTAMTAFFVFSAIGIAGLLTGTALFLTLVIFRGVMFGGALAAAVPTAQAYIASVTSTEQERVRGMAGLGAVQGVSMIAVAVVGGLLAGISLLLSIGVLPAFLLIGILVAVFGLRKSAPAELIEQPKRVSPADRRVWPYLLAGFGIFTALGFVQVLTGFFIQDRFELNSQETGFVSGIALLFAGLGTLVAQLIIVPKSGWSPPTLLRVGVPVALLGFLGVIPTSALIWFIVALFFIGLGLGIAIPGFSAGPTLLVNRDEQGGLAGLLGATTGLTFVIAPTASTALYAIWPTLPLFISVALLIAVFVLVMFHPRFRQTTANNVID